MWFFSIAFLISPAIVGQKTSTLDIYGMSHVMADLRAEMISQGLDPDQGDTDLYQPTGGRETKRFSWDGASWDVVTILKRLLWVVLAGLIALVAAIPFDRFDPATWEVEVRKKKKKRKDNVEPVAQNNEGLIASLDDPEQEFLAEGERLSALSKGRSHSRLWTTIVSEFYLMVKGRSLWWYASTAGLAIACIFSTDKIFNLLITPLSWLWPVFVWSGMGNQEIKNRTNHIVFPVAHLIKRQLLPHWVAGCILAVLATVVVALRLTMGGEWGLLLGWSVGCIFIPALALMLGVWTNGGRTFEMVYFVLWALGVKYPTVIFNFMGRSPEPGAQLVPLFYIAVTVILLMLAAVGRKKQIVSLLR
ncbi:MAG: hypothetical protein DRP45_04040 [Candidatus Zixiibacteriota bacterium]|nr:MAG: hypothetical protein DRP45_04040 [candidate division Zixibacteria bacterium]